MGPIHQLARLWHDACLRVPQRWRRPLLAAACSAALGFLIGAGLSDAALETTPTAAASIPEIPCEQQTWPYLSSTCLHQPPQPARGHPGTVRVISLDRDAPRTAYVYPEAPKAAAAKSKRPAATREVPTEGRDRRSDQRRAAPQRETARSQSAYRAYGYSPGSGPWRR